MCERMCECACVCVRAYVCVCLRICVRAYVCERCKSVSAFVRACVRVVSRDSSILRVCACTCGSGRGREGKICVRRPSRCLWQPGMRGISSTFT